MHQYDLIATTAFGLEFVVSRELRELGYDQQRTWDGRVGFRGDAMAICRTNLWLRSADRVAIKFGQFEAKDFGALFDNVKALPWSDLLPVDAKFPVNGRSVKSQLSSVPTCQSIVKKAIVESLRKTYNRSRFEESGVEYKIEVSLLNDIATITLDTSGDGLHKRGYRQKAGAAPLRETTAAALVLLSYWNRDRPFIDPFCGSGTIPIEAAMIGRNIAPGRNRSFACEDWAITTRDMWKQARQEVKDTIAPRLPYPILATDHDSKVLSFARANAAEAGVTTDLHIQNKELMDLSSKRKYGCVVCNPPWGHRLNELEELRALTRVMKSVIEPLDTWSVYVLTALRDFERQFGRAASRKRKLYNAKIESTFYQYNGPRPPEQGTESEIASATDEVAPSAEPDPVVATPEEEPQAETVAPIQVPAIAEPVAAVEPPTPVEPEPIAAEPVAEPEPAEPEPAEDNVSADSVLDHPAISGAYFFPREAQFENTVQIEVDGASLSCLADIADDPNRLTLVHFHGNGETIADYVEMGLPMMFDRMNVNSVFVEYRGYGESTDRPKLVAMLDDGEAVLQHLSVNLSKTIVFGRSIGSLYAIELAARRPELAGLIIESGIADPLERFLTYADPTAAGTTEAEVRTAVAAHFDHPAKLARFANPALLLHTEEDGLIDISHAERNHEWLASEDKKLVRFARGNHNTIMPENLGRYFAELEEFINRCR